MQLFFYYYFIALASFLNAHRIPRRKTSGKMDVNDVEFLSYINLNKLHLRVI